MTYMERQQHRALVERAEELRERLEQGRGDAAISRDEALELV
jgi:hypothetical protein